ncbi:6-phosphofructokinase [Candidatus Woesearchaeota archaeon]|nr:6-phosphofructokinase [Candidatus Woesearchaeota archaeon]
MNAVIKGAGEMVFSEGLEAVIIPQGYMGLYNLVSMDSGSLARLTPEVLDSIDISKAGSFSGNSRVKISKIEDPNKYERIHQGLEKHEIDAIIVAGGDDTGSVAVNLAQNGLKIVHAPKTMDFDLQPYSVGVDSSVNSIKEKLTELKTTNLSHNRIGILQVFGRYVGHTAVIGGIGGSADCILIPEVVPDFDIVYQHMIDTLTMRINHSITSSGYYMIITAEAMKGDSEKHTLNEKGYIIDISKEPDSFGHYPLSGAAELIQDELKRRLNE